MKTATVTDLQNRFRRVSAWIAHGETVLILKRGKPFARLTAEPSTIPRLEVPKVDFMAQLKEVWGDQVFTDEEVQAMSKAEERCRN